MEEWAPILEFPGYSVSSYGRVRNDETGRIMALTRNQHKIMHVGLTRDGEQYKRAIAPLVAHAFLDPPALETFDTPINLDGDRSNNHVENLMWRPRWFAIMYHKQFDGKMRGFSQTIQEKHTGEMFRNSFEAATRYGLLDKEIRNATLNRTYVWPTYQEFRVVEKRS